MMFNMSDFVPKKVYWQEILLHNFIQKKSAAEAHRILVETYSDHALLETTCRDWFRCFKNNGFDVEEKECSGTLKKFQDRAITSWRLKSGTSWTSRIIRSWSHNSFEMFENIRNDSKSKTLGVVWVDSKRCLITCEQLLQQQKKKDFLEHSEE